MLNFNENHYGGRLVVFRQLCGLWFTISTVVASNCWLKIRHKGQYYSTNEGSILLGSTWLVMISLKAQNWIRCFVSQISVFVAREEVRYLLCGCLNQISWVLPRNSLFALFSIELDKWWMNMTHCCLACVSLGEITGVSWLHGWQLGWYLRSEKKL